MLKKILTELVCDWSSLGWEGGGVGVRREGELEASSH